MHGATQLVTSELGMIIIEDWYVLDFSWKSKLIWYFWIQSRLSVASLELDCHVGMLVIIAMHGAS